MRRDGTMLAILLALFFTAVLAFHLWPQRLQFSWETPAYRWPITGDYRINYGDTGPNLTASSALWIGFMPDGWIVTDGDWCAAYDKTGAFISKVACAPALPVLTVK